MYCSSCGTEQPQELSYCNRCGANLRALAVQSDESLTHHRRIAGLMVAGSIFITLGGFFSVLFVFMGFITRGMNLEGPGMGLIVVILFITLGIDWLLLRMVSRILGLSGTAPKNTTPKELAEPVRRRLEEPRIPVASVTDHTTRILPPVHMERRDPVEVGRVTGPTNEP